MRGIGVLGLRYTLKDGAGGTLPLPLGTREANFTQAQVDWGLGGAVERGGRSQGGELAPGRAHSEHGKWVLVLSPVGVSTVLSPPP